MLRIDDCLLEDDRLRRLGPNWIEYLGIYVAIKLWCAHNDSGGIIPDWAIDQIAGGSPKRTRTARRRVADLTLTGILTALPSGHHRDNLWAPLNPPAKTDQTARDKHFNALRQERFRKKRNADSNAERNAERNDGSNGGVTKTSPTSTSTSSSSPLGLATTTGAYPTKDSHQSIAPANAAELTRKAAQRHPLANQSNPTRTQRNQQATQALTNLGLTQLATTPDTPW
jgi:hypothetical protein